MKKLWRDYGRLLMLAGAIIIIDQVPKILVRASLPIGEAWMPWPWLEQYLLIVHWKNTGMAMGFFSGSGWLFILLAVLVTIGTLYFFPRVPDEDRALRLAMGLQLGGVLGNMIDRLMVGYVTDFLAFGTLPVFNLADLSLYLGLLILVISVLVKPERKPEPSAPPQGQTDRQQ